MWPDGVVCLQVVLWGRSREELTHRIHSSQPIREWEGQPAHMYGEIIHSSLVSLYNSYTQVCGLMSMAPSIHYPKGTILLLIVKHYLMLAFVKFKDTNDSRHVAK